jgi:hypothetical protein
MPRDPICVAGTDDPAGPARSRSPRRSFRLPSARLSPAPVVVAAAVAALFLGVTSGTASAKTTTTTTKPATTTTAAGSATTAPASPADRWILRAIAAERQVGSVRIVGKITQGKREILFNLLVNGDGEGGGVFSQEGSLIRIERVGPLLYFNAPKSFWASNANAQQTKTFGGRWIEISALDARFTSFDQFLDAADLVTAAFQGHTAPLTVSTLTTYQGHKVVIVKDTVSAGGKKSTGLMYIGATGPSYVYKIVNNTPGEVGALAFSHYGNAVPLTVPPNAINLT